MKDILANEPVPGGLKRRSVQGGAAVLFAQGATLVIGTLTTMFLARLLTKADFGLVAMAAVILNLAVLFQNIGLDTAVIRARSVTHEQVSALFWVNLAIGTMLMLLVIACAPLAAAFFGQPDLTAVIAALGPSFLFTGAMLQHQALLRRRMLFARLAAVTIAAQIAASIAAVAFAFAYRSYWALVLLRFTQAAAFALAVWVVCPWRPSRPAGAAGLRPMLAFAGNLTGSRFVQYMMRNADNLLIGKFIGQAPLGAYDRAYALLLLPIRQLNLPLSSVVNPGLARVVHDRERFVAYYVRALNTMTFLSMPLVAFSILAAPEIIGIVLGPGWESSLTLFYCLAPAAFMGSFNMATSWVFVALGRADRELRMALVTGVIGLAAMVVGLRWGAAGVAIAVSLATVLVRPLQLVYCFRGSPVSMRDFLRAIARPSFASLAACAAAALVPMPGALLLSAAAKAALFGLLYAGLYAVLPGGLRQLRQHAETLREFRPARRG